MENKLFVIEKNSNFFPDIPSGKGTVMRLHLSGEGDIKYLRNCDPILAFMSKTTTWSCRDSKIFHLKNNNSYIIVVVYEQFLKQLIKVLKMFGYRKVSKETMKNFLLKEKCNYDAT